MPIRAYTEVFTARFKVKSILYKSPVSKSFVIKIRVLSCN